MHKKLFLSFKVLLTLAILTIILYLYWQSQLTSLSAEKTEKDFMIAQGESVTSVAKNLKQSGLIKNATAFRFYVVLSGKSTTIQAGKFRLAASQSAKEIANQITHGAIDFWVTIPEGWRVEEIADRFSSRLEIDRDAFLKSAQEGYMFPDTYLIPKSYSAQQIALMMKDNFNKRVDENLKMELNSTDLNLKDAVIIASMVEREAKFSKDRPIVAGILINRLKSNIPLQVDATIQYAIGNSQDKKNYWPQIFENDLQIESTYNTYKKVGLPPTPIANPGLDSISATIFYKQSDFFYYLSDKIGKMHYAKTLEEHNQNIAKFL